MKERKKKPEPKNIRQVNIWLADDLADAFERYMTELKGDVPAISSPMICTKASAARALLVTGLQQKGYLPTATA